MYLTNTVQAELVIYLYTQKHAKKKWFASDGKETNADIAHCENELGFELTNSMK